MSGATVLPTIEDIETLWGYMMEEMIAAGEVSRFSADVINVDGTQTNCEVVRVGVYNAVCGDKYLEYVPSKGQYQFLARQPAGRYTNSADRLSDADASSADNRPPPRSPAEGSEGAGILATDRTGAMSLAALMR